MIYKESFDIFTIKFPINKLKSVAYSNHVIYRRLRIDPDAVCQCIIFPIITLPAPSCRIIEVIEEVVQIARQVEESMIQPELMRKREVRDEICRNSHFRTFGIVKILPADILAVNRQCRRFQ